MLSSMATAKGSSPASKAASVFQYRIIVLGEPELFVAKSGCSLATLATTSDRSAASVGPRFSCVHRISQLNLTSPWRTLCVDGAEGSLGVVAIVVTTAASTGHYPVSIAAHALTLGVVLVTGVVRFRSSSAFAPY